MLTLQLVLGLVCTFHSGIDSEQPAAQDDSEKSAVSAIRKSVGVDFAVMESKIRRSTISTRTPYGFKIGKVEKDSPAARADWKEGDILLEWNEQPVKTLAGLASAIKEGKSGESIKFKLARYKKDAPITSRQPWQYIEGKMVPK